MTDGGTGGIEVRRLRPEERTLGTGLVAESMLGSLAPEVAQAWAELWGDVEHGALAPDGQLVGVVRWFPSQASMAGTAVDAACVTAVAVRSTHRRRGVLRTLMRAQLDSIVEAGVPLGLLIAAEWPIYGRYGYGPAIDACRYEIDATTARFTAEPSGSISLVTPEELRPHLEAVHDRRWARTMGAITRSAATWDRLAGVTSLPNDRAEPGTRRGAIWRDAAGEVQGAVAYRVTEDWTHNRPTGTADVGLLVGATAEAERELWRFLCELDWITRVSAGARAVDDPLPLWLDDGRAAVQLDRSDCIWARVLDVPGVFEARRAPVPGRAVVEVLDDPGYAAGRWSLDLGPDGAAVTRTTDAADVQLPARSLGALSFGGTSAARLQSAGWLDELTPGGVARLDALLHAPAAPWSPTTF